MADPTPPMATVTVGRSTPFSRTSVADRGRAGGASDNELMCRIARGDADAFGDLFDRYAARAYRVAYSICQESAQAEDAVQEGFLALWRSRSSYTEGGGVAAWAMSIMRHRAIDTVRRVRANEFACEDPEVLGAGTRAPNREADGAAELRDALARLPEPQREVIVLAFYGELSHAEIAEHLKLPPGTVKGRMRLGLEKLSREDALRDSQPLRPTTG